MAVVERRLAQGRLDSTMAWARVAAGFSVHNPTGALRSPRLEAALDEVSRLTMGETTTTDRATGRRVLHVLTETHRVGGHIRFALRWAALDEMSQTCFVITGPGADAPAVYDAVRRTGPAGDVTHDSTAPTP